MTPRWWFAMVVTVIARSLDNFHLLINTHSDDLSRFFREAISFTIVIARILNNLIYFINLIATKQSLSYRVASYQKIASATRSFIKIKLRHVPRNDAAVVRFALGGIANEEAGLMFVLSWLL